LKGLEETSNTEVKWKSTKRVMTDMTDEDTGEREARYNVEWFDDECMDATEQKNKNQQKCSR
jgi:hypothetical protein